MRTKYLLGAFPLTVAALAIAMVAAVARAQDADRKELPDRPAEKFKREDRPRRTDLINDVEESGLRAAPAVPSHWIGLSLGPVPPALRSQLPLPQDQGLLVMGVLPDGPAANAGIKQYDIFLTIGGQAVKDSHRQALSRVVEDVNGKEITVELLRAGKTMSVAVMPKETPREPAPPADQWFGNDMPFRFKVMHPGFMIGRAKREPFPADLNLQISKHGNRPAEIEAKQGDNTWNVTEETLDKLPDAVRGHVEGFLGRFTIKVPPPMAEGMGPTVSPYINLLMHDEFAPVPELRQLKEINDQLRQMRKELDELRSERRPPAPSAQEQPQDSPE